MTQTNKSSGARNHSESITFQKILLIFCLFIFSLGITIAENVGRLFPSIPAAVFVICSIAVAYTLYTNDLGQNRILYLLGLIILFSISVRVYIFTFPVSMIGYDPDTFAITIRKLLNEGYIQDSLSQFYSNAPLFHIYIAIISLIINSTPAEAMTVLPLLVGLIFPLTAFIYCSYILNNIKVGLIASVLSAVLANSVTFSYIPIPQIISTVLFLLFCVCLINYILGGLKHIYLIIVFIVALIFTHKFHPLVVSGTILSIIFLQKIRIVKNKHLPNRGSSDKMIISAFFVVIFAIWTIVVFKPAPQLVIVGGIFTLVSIIKVKKSDETIRDGFQSKNRASTPRSTSRYLPLFAISAILLFTQWTITTQLFNRVIYGIRPLFVSTTTQASQTSQNFQTIDRGLLNIFFHHSDILIVVLLTSFAWLFIFHYFRGIPSLVLLAGSSVPMALLPFALYAGTPGGINDTRILLAFSPIAIALLTVFLLQHIDKYIVPIIILIIVLQVFSAGFVPDAYGTRSYLSETEVSGKTFNTKYVSSTIYSDEFYSSESISPVTDYTHQEEAKYLPFDWKIITDKDTMLQYRCISLRTDTSQFVTKSKYDSVFNKTNIQYNNYYSNGGVKSYVYSMS